MSPKAKVSLNWLETIPHDLVSLKSFVAILENPYEVKKLVACSELIRELITRFRNVYDVLERLQERTLQDADNAPELRELMPDIVLAAHRLREFLKRFSEEQFLCRLIRNQKLVQCLQQAHDGVDDFLDRVQRSRFGDLFSGFAASSNIDIVTLNQSEDDWIVKVGIASQALREEIDQARSGGNEEQREERPKANSLSQLFQLTKSHVEITAENTDPKNALQEARMKALWTLEFEKQRSSRRGTSDPFVGIAEVELDPIVDATDVKGWFIPSDEVTCGIKIGEGGFGVVCLGMFGSKTRVVVKRSTKSFDKEAVLREISIWYQLKHPHILQFIGATYLDSTCSLVSEFARHGQLDRYLAIRGNEKLVWRLLYEAALGLHYMHQQGYVHGDLKCNNILIGDDLKAKLADFGLSFKKGEHRSVLCTGAANWLAPECLDNEKERNFSTDVFMFGMCIVEALSGSPPWGNVSKAQVNYQFRKSELPYVIKLFAPKVQDLVKGMCALDPTQRMKLEDVIATLKEFADANDPSLVVVSGEKK